MTWPDVRARLGVLPWSTYLATALAAYTLKAYYSRAAVDDLGWILRPTAAVVGWLLGEPLERSPSLGWMPADRTFVIAPVCAGVNFLILAFTVPVFGFVHRFRASHQRWGWAVGVTCAAYSLTIAVNALRILLAIGLYRAEAHAGWLTAERVHRLAGTILYVAGLGAAWAAADHLSGGRQRDVSGSWQPVLVLPAAYLGMTVALPLANGAWRHFGARYLEHALTVSVVTTVAVFLLSLTRCATRGSERWRSH